MKTIQELKDRNAEIKSELESINTEFRGQAFPEEARNKWNELNEERDDNNKLIKELEAREQIVATLSGNESAREEGAHFQTARPGSTRGEDIWDLTTIRASAFDPSVARVEIQSRAMRALETAKFPMRRDQAQAREHVEKLLENDSIDSEVGRRILATGRPIYARAFAKFAFGQQLSNEERAAMAVGVGSTGGFAVVYTLDPTIVPTSSLSVNPFRSISRVEQISGTNEWRGVTSAGVSAAYASEATEASDNSPTLAQPAVIVNRAQCFVPVSIELTQDLPSLQASLARLIQDAKDDLEAVQFTTGTGTPPAPAGIITGATTTVTTVGVAGFAIADLYKLEEALGPRFRARASLMGNRFTFNKVRQFDTAGGSGVWSLDALPGNLQAGLPSQAATPGHLNQSLLGYPAYEDSGMVAALTTGSKILIMGDFSYFVIVDRIGMDIEVVPHLFGATNRFPTGQRGIFAMWRNNSKVLDANAFRVLITQ